MAKNQAKGEAYEPCEDASKIGATTCPLAGTHQAENFAERCKISTSLDE